ncbi:hypothetical protein ACFOEM_06630 [Paenalcaligenes hominis]
MPKPCQDRRTASDAHYLSELLLYHLQCFLTVLEALRYGVLSEAAVHDV